nr:hypothetical protein [Tanacetum cinerariifolium]
MPLQTTLMETCASLSQKVAENVESINDVEDITLVDVEKNEKVVAMDAEPQERIDQEEVNAASKGVSATEPTVFDDKESFKDMLKGFNREDLVDLWNLVKEKFSSTVPSVDKEKALWVELKRLFEPDADDVLWKLQRHDMFMLTDKDYPLSNAVMTLMLSAKLQVKEDNEMARDLVMKIFIEANKPKS